jgi:predicted deacylase
MKTDHGQAPGSSVKIRYSFVKLLTGSDLAWRRLPFMSAQSIHSGPVVWLTACSHGDEVGGVIIIQELFKQIRRQLQKGAVCAFPMMNPIGFEIASRELPLSNEDLNRAFPGNPKGSLADRIADKIFSNIMQTNPTLVLDLHNDWQRSIPYCVIDPCAGPEARRLHEKVEQFSRLTGLLLIQETEVLRHSLSWSLRQRDVPALTLELGESNVVNEGNIDCGVNSVWNLLAQLAMVPPAPEPYGYPVPEQFRGQILQYTDQPFSSSSGIVRFAARPGQIVRKGQVVTRIYNTFGKLQETVTSPQQAIVLGQADASIAFPGVPLIAFGVP